MRRPLIVILIVLSIFMLVSGCTISPMRTEPEGSQSVNKPTASDNNVEGGKDAASTKDEAITLNILAPRMSVLQAGNKNFPQLIPEGITLNFVSAEQDIRIRADELIPKLLAHSSEIDIFCVRSDQEFTKSVIDKGYYVDLLQNKQLAALFDEMYPQIREWSMVDGKAFGFPSLVMPYAHMLINENGLKEAGYTVDDLKTFADVMRFSDAWTKAHQEKGVYMSKNETYPAILTSYLLPRYDYEKMDVEVDNAEFRALVESVKELMQEQRLGDADAVGFHTIPFHEVPVYIGNVFPAIVPPDYEMGQRTSVPVPLVENEKNGKRTIDMSYYIINPFSKHIDKAMQLMVQIGKMSKIPMAKELLYKDMASYRFEETDEINGSPMTALYNKKELFEAMGRFLDQHEMYYAFPGLKDILDTCNDYFKDSITLDEAVDKIKRTIDIVRRENLQ